MFKKILYPTDFSDVAAKALDYIEQLKEAGAQEVVILHVINQRIIDGLRRHAILDKDILQWKKKAQEIAEESLAEMSKALENIGFTVKPIIRTGFPWREILEVEEQENPSLIVIGSHGRSNLSDMFLGAVSDRVIRKSKGPVMVIKRDTED
ncbi:universal stress protein [uncultured Desulfosarcina sp.]|uniref:universal stress protein n=1 Tax=uncultured Desulfosarcina sp. TaxID=218289 RepID=UPI0029C7BF78|nr:universal stress protein [uncultured Desulfosarcina sp.]